MFLLVVALAFAVSMIAAIPSMIIIFTAAAHGTEPAAGSVAFIVAEMIRAVLDLVLQIALAPISAIALVLFYFDQRIRKEGFDIEWMMQQAGLAPIHAESENTAPAFGPGLSQAAPAAASSDAPDIFAPPTPPDTVE